MRLIVAVDENWGIGYKGTLLAHLPGDLKYFKEKTTGKVVIMGQNTLISFPKSKPLPNRTNIVLSNDPSFVVEGAIMARSLDEVRELVKKYNTDDVFVIGGASVYRQLLDDCDTAYITKVHKKFEADVFFPNLDEKENWTLSNVGESGEDNEITYTFTTYTKTR